MPEQKNRLFINLAVVVLSFAISLLLCEVLIRCFYGDTLQRAGVHKFFCQYDKLLGWVKIPNAKGTHVTNEFAVFESFNSKGIRGPEYSYKKGENEYRILVLGDSFAEGYTVEFEEMFSEILKKKLNNKLHSKYYEIINTGTVGYSTDQELLLFQNEGKKYNPDLTLLMFYDNDVFFNTQTYEHWCGNKPGFKLKDGKLSPINIPVPKEDVNQKQTKKLTRLRKAKDWLDENSYLYKFIKVRAMTVPVLYKLAIKLGLSQHYPEPSQKQKTDLVPNVFKVWNKRKIANISYAWEITEALLVKLKEEATAAGSKFLVCYVPNRAVIYNKTWKATKRKYGMSDKNWAMNQVGMKLGVVCKKNNIDYINPTQPFKEAADRLMKQGERMYFIDDDHWNARGHKFMAEFLYKHINSAY